MKYVNIINRLMHTTGLRKPYNARSNVFLEDQIAIKDPLHLFKIWFDEAKNNPSIVEPNAMCLSTATRYKSNTYLGIYQIINTINFIFQI